MIEEPPLLTIRARDARPTKAQIAALRGQPTGYVVDAMYGAGALPHEIRALAPGEIPVSVCGPALTAECGPADVLGSLVAVAECEPGEIIVACAAGWRGCAAAGDRIMGMARNRGAAGYVTDGLVRDRAGLVEVGLPVYAAGLSPNSPFGSGPCTVGFPVMRGGVRVATGDVIVADENGVVVVPFARLDEVIARLERVRELEEALDAEVRAGLEIPDEIRELIASDRTRRV